MQPRSLVETYRSCRDRCDWYGYVLIDEQRGNGTSWAKCDFEIAMH